MRPACAATSGSRATRARPGPRPTRHGADQSISTGLQLADGSFVFVGLGGQVLYSPDGEKFTLTYRADRKGLNAVMQDGGSLLVFGEAGVQTQSVKDQTRRDRRAPPPSRRRRRPASDTRTGTRSPCTRRTGRRLDHQPTPGHTRTRLPEMAAFCICARHSDCGANESARKT